MKEKEEIVITEYNALWEKAFDRVLGPLDEFIHRQTTSGVLLMGGIGFTMSIFIAESGCAHHAEDLLMAKTGILILQLTFFPGKTHSIMLVLLFRNAGS